MSVNLASVVWTTSPPGIVAISPSGVITALKPGRVGISFAVGSLSSRVADLDVLALYARGDLFGGGTVCYVDGTGKHGLICGPQMSGFWGPSGVTGATSQTDGMANTNAIIAKHGNGTYAAKRARDYAGGGFTDWFLPAFEQLRVSVFPTSVQLFWSSTEVNTNDALAKASYGTEEWSKFSTIPYFVPVRAF